MTPQEKITAVYAKLHANRWEHVEQARRARDYQTECNTDGYEKGWNDAVEYVAHIMGDGEDAKVVLEMKLEPLP